MGIHRGEIQKPLINRIRHECWRVFFKNQKHLARQFAVGVIMRTAQHTSRTKPFRLETGRARLDAVFLRQPVCRNHNAVAASPATDPNRAAFQLGIERDFATGKEGISVNVQNAIVAGAHRQETRYSIVRRRPYRVVHRPSLPHPLGQYLSNQKTLTAVTNARFASLHGLPVALLPFDDARSTTQIRALVTSLHGAKAAGAAGFRLWLGGGTLRSGCVLLCASLRPPLHFPRSPTTDRSRIVYYPRASRRDSA